MKRPRWVRRSTTVAVAGCLLAATASLATAAGSAAADAVAARATVTGPAEPGGTVKLIMAQNSVTVPRYGGAVYLDPGVYVTAVGSPLQFDIRRASYASPLTITQIIRLPGRTLVRPLPRYVLNGMYGLRNFMRYTITNASGKVLAARRLGFCPDSYDPQRATPGSPATSPFPTSCAADPFPESLVFGVQKEWGVDPFEYVPPVKLALGSYRLTASITHEWTRLLHVPAADASATVKVTVVKGTGCCGARAARPDHPEAGSLPRLPAVRYLAHPPQSELPDLVPLPSWGILVQVTKATKKQPANDQLAFGATVAVDGNSPLDVEGFRSHGSPIMKAYQYFWRNGRVVGRARAGTMGFDNQKGHNHWHFEQFARYQLLNSTKTLVVRSRKVGFCIAPTDPVNLLLPHAQWNPPYTGFSGACGSPSALWVQEYLPLGWADTYIQDVAGQSFDITHLPNGVYYIEVIANPEGVLHETSTRNDISLRKVILGGTVDHRTVRVPALDGIDPEG